MVERKMGPSIDALRSRCGEVIGVSRWFVLDQPRIDVFAETTDDRNFIHVDPQQAQETAFGGTIAHGFLTLTLLSAMMEDGVGWPEGAVSVNYGLDRVRFLMPVRSGKRVRGHFRLTELVEKRPGEWQQKVEATVEIEGEAKPALFAEWITLQSL